MSIQDLMAQRAEIDRQISETKNANLATCLSTALAVFTDSGFTREEAASAMAAAFSRKVKKPRVAKLAPKYRNPETGATWSGRGVQPKWYQAGNYTAA